MKSKNEVVIELTKKFAAFGGAIIMSDKKIVVQHKTLSVQPEIHDYMLNINHLSCTGHQIYAVKVKPESVAIYITNSPTQNSTI